jgi:hypothetical protein
VIPNLYRKTFRLLFSGNEDFSVVGSFYFGGRTGEMTVVAYSVNAISIHEGPPQEETHVANCVTLIEALTRLRLSARYRT